MDSEKRHFLPERMGVTVAFEPSRRGGRELGPSVVPDWFAITGMGTARPRAPLPG